MAIVKSFTYDDHFLDHALVKACALHLTLIILAVIGHFIWQWDIFKDFKKDKKISIVESSVRVDLVGLPKHTLQELKAIDLSSTLPKLEKTPRKVQIQETSKVEFKTIKKKVNLSNLLANISQNKVVKKKRLKKKQEKKVDLRAIKELVLEGNKVSKGSSISGEQLDMSKQVFISYIQGLPDQIRPQWKLPTYLLDKTLQCRVQIFIGTDGKVLKIVLYESSGDGEYDSKAIQAIKLSSPLAKPPSSILSQVTGGQVVLGFPL